MSINGPADHIQNNVVLIGPLMRRVFENVWSETLAKRAGVKPTAIQRMMARGWTFHNGAA